MPSSTQNQGQQSSKKEDPRLSKEQKENLLNAPGITPKQNESRSAGGEPRKKVKWADGRS